MSNNNLEALEHEYQYLRDENIRLRDGRAALTRQLGPLPIGAAVVAGLVTGFTSRTPNNGWLWAALSLFVVMVLVSVLYSSMKPYRELRADVEASVGERPTTSSEAWYEEAIKLERGIYGENWPKERKNKGYYERHRPSRKSADCRRAMTANGAACSSSRDCSRS